MRLLAAAAFITLPTSVFADIACRDIDADLDRLACHDKESGRTPKVEVEAPSIGKGKWIVRNSVSEMTDSKDVFLHLQAEQPVTCRSYSGAERPVLLLRCMENTTAIMVSTDSCHLTSSRYNDYGDIEYRVDDNASKTKGFEASTSNDTLGLWSGGAAIPFIKGLLGSEKVIMRFTPYGQSAVTVTFPTAGIDEAIKPLRDACGW